MWCYFSNFDFEYDLMGTTTLSVTVDQQGVFLDGIGVDTAESVQDGHYLSKINGLSHHRIDVTLVTANLRTGNGSVYWADCAMSCVLFH
ncbi:hypothetical protein GO730_37650 [Spirosoma sp. HMF3257]|uniref:hypothetical protein n=1 Tax=Spirosoma telluris TaxID=2183553 RepID=UPI000DACD409|nr:hypothetical protein [Spirosoma telluris]